MNFSLMIIYTTKKMDTKDSLIIRLLAQIIMRLDSHHMQLPYILFILIRRIIYELGTLFLIQIKIQRIPLENSVKP